MVDVRYLNTVEIKGVLARTAAPHDHIVPLCRGGCHAGIGLDHFGDVPVSAWRLLDLLEVDPLERYRTVFIATKGRCPYHDLIDLVVGLFKGDLNIYLPGIGDLDRF